MESTGTGLNDAHIPSVTLSGLCEIDLIHSSTAVDPTSTEAATTTARATLFDLLANSLILQQTAPYLPPSAVCALAATCKGLHDIVYKRPETFRYLDLSTLKKAMIDDLGPIDQGGFNWRAERMDEALTEDEFYSGPIRGILSGLGRRQVLNTISTLVLDGLSIPADVVREIITEDRYNVRILSIRESKHLNERKLCQVLKYAVRPTRPEGIPRLKGLYVFGPMDLASFDLARENSSGRKRSPTRYPDSDPSGLMDAVGAQLGAEWNRKSQQAMQALLSRTHDRWWNPSGRMFRKTPASEWAETLKACEGIIAFDAVLCRGPRHDAPKIYSSAEEETHNYLPAAVATVALGSVGCAKCGSYPEGWTTFESSPSHQLPLLAPPPLHSSTVKAAQRPLHAHHEGEPPGMVVRCLDCLRGRWCERCHRWWCENCYTPTTRTQLQQHEYVQQAVGMTGENWAQEGAHQAIEVKVHMGLCVDTCLVGELMSGAGESGMWG